MVDRMRQGQLAPNPADLGECRMCDTRDVCRYEVRGAAAAGEGQ